MSSSKVARTESYYRWTPPQCLAPRQCPKGDPVDSVPIPFHEALKNISHITLQKPEPPSPPLKSFEVSVFDGSTGKSVYVKVKSTDTIAKLQQKFLQHKPDLVSSLNLAYNGKPVQLQQTMCELQVKPGSMFITYRMCPGG
ncbi:hypothetical protein DNTS_031394 [Danionella cerebrum]|uniref:Ubiquitin-like domain-containing protein n=1 Tax=Danionella cerebrum TaxID=2873325 RepID=A0A553MMH0_9TELE|nr:hypothetical protein DNTS_031394 [Danionella translucida]